MTKNGDQALEYRQAFKRLYYFTLVGAFLAEVLILRVNLAKFSDQSQLIMGLKILAASSIPLSVLIRLLFFVRPRLFARYWLEDERLVIERGKKKFELKFSDISRILISKLSPRFLGGFMVEMRSGQKLRFPSALYGNYLILEKAAKVCPKLLPEQVLSPYLLLSKQVDASWTRMARKI